MRTVWQRPEGGVRYECGTPGAGQWSCTVPKNSCEAAYVPPLHGQGEDGLLINQPRQRGTADPNKITQRGTRITLANGARKDLGHRCITLGTPGAASAPGAPPVVITVTREDFATLPVQPLKATAGPPGGWLPVNMVNVLHTNPVEQTLATTLLGTPVQIRAIPIEYHWDLGDGNTITTSKPGKPFPSEEVTSTYRYEGWYDITLTTTFAGQFSINGGPWQDIDGTITITSDPVPLYSASPASYTHLRAHETRHELVCRLLLEKKKICPLLLEKEKQKQKI
nr:PKD domain-containing protein [Brachybacterium timonense]